MMQRPNSSSSSVPNHHFNPYPIRSPLPFTGNRVGAPPPISPYSQIPATLQPKHSRSISQPSSYFDSLPSVEDRNGSGFSPSLPPSPFTISPSTSRVLAGGENLPPKKSHRRSNSHVAFGFMPQSPPLIPSKEESREGGRTPESESLDDVFRAYMNLDNIDVFNSFGSKTNGGGSSSDSEGESWDNVKVSSGVKRRAPTSRHYRSVSMDSCFLPKLNFGDESSSPKLPPLSAKVSPTNSGEGNSSAYSVEFGNSEFTAAEMKKISADEKLAEIVMVDPKRVKRILANRVSAARSKERKTQYMTELEHKVQTLQSEATTLSAQLTHLQRDSMGLTNQNNELKFRLQAMEQQAQLRDALSEKLTEEVQRLRLVIGEPSRRQSGRESNISKTSIDPEMFQQQLRISQLHQQQSNQNSTMKANHASNE